MRRLLFSATAAAALLLPGVAAAAVITIDNMTATWSNAIPGAAYTDNGTNNPKARWGTSTGSGQSGYDFLGATPPALEINVPPSPSGNFILGTFTHVNQPIRGTSITSIRLTVSAQILIDSVDQGFRNFIFNFTHEETPNNPNPCPYGGPNGVGVNRNGCADRVTVSVSTLTESFTVDGEDYTLRIRGFQIGGNFATEFLTAEREDNVAFLLADIVLRSQAIPEPATLALFGAGLLGLGLARRRRRA